MPRRLSPAERETYLAEPHIGVLSVASDDGRPPLAMPVWYHYQPGGVLNFFTGTQGRKARKMDLIAKHGVVSFTVQRTEWPYKFVTIEGTVIATDQPPSRDQVLAIVRRYLPEEMAQGFAAAELTEPSATFTLYTVRPDRWLTNDFSDEAE